MGFCWYCAPVPSDRVSSVSIIVVIRDKVVSGTHFRKSDAQIPKNVGLVLANSNQNEGRLNLCHLPAAVERRTDHITRFISVSHRMMDICVYGTAQYSLLELYYYSTVVVLYHRDTRSTQPRANSPILRVPYKAKRNTTTLLERRRLIPIQYQRYR
jgi:hypothetical protein